MYVNVFTKLQNNYIPSWVIHNYTVLQFQDLSDISIIKVIISQDRRRHCECQFEKHISETDKNDRKLEKQLMLNKSGTSCDLD